MSQSLLACMLAVTAALMTTACATSSGFATGPSLGALSPVILDVDVVRDDAPAARDELQILVTGFAPVGEVTLVATAAGQKPVALERIDDKTYRIPLASVGFQEFVVRARDIDGGETASERLRIDRILADAGLPAAGEETAALSRERRHDR